MNYFEYYGLPISLVIDGGLLKRSYINKSRLFHPDFHMEKSEAEREEVLKQASYNNKAYKTLKSDETRLRYVLELHDALGEEGTQTLPQEFLIEMMDINERIMEMQMSENQEEEKAVLAEVESFNASLYTDVKSIYDNYDYERVKLEELEILKEFFFKRKYLRRIKENLNKFAPEL